MTYRTILNLIIILTFVVIVGSLSTFYWGIMINDPSNPSFDLEGASGLATIIPSFAGVLLAAYSVYIYTKAEDPLLKKSQEVIYSRDKLMRLLDDAPILLASALTIGQSTVNTGKRDDVEEVMFEYFTNYHNQLDHMSKIFKDSDIVDFLMKAHPEKSEFIREFAHQTIYYSELLKNKVDQEPITGAKVMLLICKTCEKYREFLDGIDVKSHEVCKKMKEPYPDEKNPFQENRYRSIFGREA